MPGAFRTILFAGLVAGFLDIAAASLHYFISTGKGPTRVFQFIASAIFGKAAFSGGLGMAALGLLFHFIISIGFAGLLYTIYPYVYNFLRNRFLIGFFYGVMVWLVMNTVIVPLTRAPQFQIRWESALIGMGILILLVGIPIALIVHRFYRSSGVFQ